MCNYMTYECKKLSKISVLFLDCSWRSSCEVGPISQASTSSISDERLTNLVSIDAEISTESDDVLKLS